MKNLLCNILFLSVLSVTIISCKDKAKEAETKEFTEAIQVKQETQKFTANLENSIIEWTGFKPTGSHNGTINIKSGTLNTLDGNLTGGTFLIDMSSIKVLDIPADNEGNGKLLGHLTSPDFFNVEQYPNSTFEITSLKEVDNKMMLSGNLTLKDVKNNITFPVTVSHDGNTFSLKSDVFTIDRSKWNVKYGSKSFFGNLGDKFINDDIELKISVIANKG